MTLERREDYPKILDKISNIEVNISKIATLVEERNSTALLWRAEVCSKFKEIKDHCAVRQASKLRMWVAIGAVVISGLFGIGSAYKQIEINTERLNKLEQPLYKK